MGGGGGPTTFIPSSRGYTTGLSDFLPSINFITILSEVANPGPQCLQQYPSFDEFTESWKAVCLKLLNCTGRMVGWLKLCTVLGDPDCAWSEGKRPAKRSDLSHPGICEPVYSRRCSFQKWFTCPRVKSSCKAKDEPGVRSIDLRLSPKKVSTEVLLCNRRARHVCGANSIAYKLSIPF